MAQDFLDTIKITEVSITSLKITAEDDWLRDHIEKFGDSVETSPHFFYLQGTGKYMYQWMKFRGLREDYVTKPLMDTLRSLWQEGMKEPILVYSDGRINTGHKRAAIKLFLGDGSIMAKIVPDDYKL